ncbi:hypothetical protein BC938DRAFT_482268 [Jimgerdemannia flammicorona]|uniref:Uncharacterized protein n=1 Tax=Jimgerdemannia flammicorona TaxID=994334 RepID=A0A433QED8_9FUNG|nr:hypothetical protein BC938DRAFT_482268 [Jimgerdemannia flammicorona]
MNELGFLRSSSMLFGEIHCVILPEIGNLVP